MRHFIVLSAVFLGLSLSPHIAQAEQNTQLAQAGDADYRVSVLEEQIRQLNGKIEDLNFQLLELQEFIRRMQEDNDFRFQQLEEKQGSLDTGEIVTSQADDDGFIRLEKPQPSDQNTQTSGSDGQSASIGQTKTIDGVEIYQGDGGIDENQSGTLGTIQFDENGNIISSEIGKPLDLMATLNSPNRSVSTGLPNDPDGLFSTGFDMVQQGRYEEASVALEQFSQSYETHPRLPEARFWLGESYLGRSQYRDAAEVYLDTHKRWPNSKYGPQSLLKLGVSMAGLNQRELACATFAEVLQKYPNASRALQQSLQYEQRAAKCATN